MTLIVGSRVVGFEWLINGIRATFARCVNVALYNMADMRKHVEDRARISRRNSIGDGTSRAERITNVIGL